MNIQAFLNEKNLEKQLFEKLHRNKENIEAIQK